MTCGLGAAGARIDANRLDEVEARRAVVHERPLRQAFAPFLLREAVRHDSRSQTHCCFVLPRLQGECPDGDIERCFAVRRNPSYRARIDMTLLPRSEEHTYELQSLMRISYADFCLKKKTY